MRGRGEEAHAVEKYEPHDGQAFSSLPSYVVPIEHRENTSYTASGTVNKSTTVGERSQSLESSGGRAWALAGLCAAKLVRLPDTKRAGTCSGEPLSAEPVNASEEGVIR